MYFEESHVDQLARPYHWSLIGKYSHGYNKLDPKLGHPSIEDLQKYFRSLDLISFYSVGLLDNRHLFIKLNYDENSIRILAQFGKLGMSPCEPSNGH